MATSDETHRAPGAELCAVLSWGCAPPEGQVEGERPVAVAEQQREDGRSEAHDDGAADCRGLQCRRAGEERQHAHNGQHQDDGAADG